MDNYLDFYNSLNEYVSTLTEDDSVMVLTHNLKNHNSIIYCNGEWEQISTLISEEGAILNPTESQLSDVENIKKWMLNISMNILIRDKEKRDIVMNHLANEYVVPEMIEQQKAEEAEVFGNKLFRCEFSEKQNWLRLDNYTHEPETNGFITVFESCTDQEFKVFETYLKTLHPVDKYTNSIVIDAAAKLESFSSSLLDRNMMITKF